MFKNLCRLASVAMLSLSFVGCAIMHHTQISEVDARIVERGERFEVLVSETGINLDEVEGIGKAMTNHKKTQEDIQAIRSLIGLFQMGPKTGNPVYNETYADEVAQMIRSKCPNGYISGLMSVREMAKYPVVSGEVIRLIGYCYKKS